MKYKYDLIQDGIVVASVIAPTRKEAEKEIKHYIFMYGQDGPIEIKPPLRMTHRTPGRDE